VKESCTDLSRISCAAERNSSEAHSRTNSRRAFFSCRRCSSRRDHVLSVQGIQHIARRNAFRLHLVLVHVDRDLRALASIRERQHRPRYGHQLGANRVLTQVGQLLLVQALTGDTELNPVPKTSSCKGGPVPSVPRDTAKMGAEEYDVRTNAAPHTIDELGMLPIKDVNGAVVYMRTWPPSAVAMTIGFGIFATGRFFPAIIKEFKRRYQDVQVSLVEMTPVMHHKALQSGTIDVAFTRPMQSSDAENLRFEHLQTQPFCAVILKSHPLAKKRSILIRELANERFILIDRNSAPVTFDKVISLCAEAGFSPRIGATSTASTGMIALVAAGEGVALLADDSAVLRGNELVAVPLADAMASVDLVIAWAPHHENPVLRSFLDVAIKKRRKP
jgi:LysR substrate binding domain